eukprot:TRINITY_DN2950_c0_g1_i12.p1 TRINITY_DN2950_c0_g1~~TRINITY_DN2950_c0_g1_i12.p1  ORF type:complete len:365 (+),score=57.74 TRINITY_DN2950_c0_g1_i12:73-1167(+)
MCIRDSYNGSNNPLTSQAMLMGNIIYVFEITNLMDFNSIIFPRPKPSYSAQSLFGNIIYIPKSKQFSISEIQAFRSSLSLSKQVITNQVNSPKHKQVNFIADSFKSVSQTQDTTIPSYIPCLFLPYNHGSTKLLLYFHGNAEDVGGTLALLDTLKSKLKVHVMAMEYPGYGIYQGSPSADAILKDTDRLFGFLTKILGILPSDIIIFGRSIGSGPATYLASRQKVFALVLMSAYTSIRAVAKHLAGALCSLLVADRFRNIDLIPLVKSPIFIVHGMRDPLIPFGQAQELCEQCKEATLVLPERMDHNVFDTKQDLIVPLKSFLEKHEYEPTPKEKSWGWLGIPASLFLKPAEGKDKGLMSKLFG